MSLLPTYTALPQMPAHSWPAVFRYPNTIGGASATDCHSFTSSSHGCEARRPKSRGTRRLGLFQ